MAFDEPRWRASLLAARKEKDGWMKRDPHSPIPRGERAAFAGLSYWEPDPRFRFAIRPEPLHGAAPVVMQTSDGQIRHYTPAAKLTFEVGGETATVVAYEQGHEWFLPFRDATSGKESYGAGRYLEVQPGDPCVLDFNQAYNPWCAYSEDFSCPFPPFDNWLKVAVRAGERTYDGTAAPQSF